MYGAEADDSMTARRDCLGSIDMNDGIVRRPRYGGWTRDRYDCSRASPFHSHERAHVFGAYTLSWEWRMKSTAFYLDMIPVLAIDPSQSRDGFG